MILTEPFKLNSEGYALLQKFILLRMEMDINDEKKELELLKSKREEISHKSGFFNSINKFHKDQSVNKVQDRIRKKENWKIKWTADNLSFLEPFMRDISIQKIIERLNKNVNARVQLYLILQEVIHTPIFNGQEGFETAGEERSLEKTINYFTQLCGLHSSAGLKIIEETKSFFKDIKKENTNILKWGLYGLIGISTLASILAMPVIAPAIGGLMGLSGAAATASGLAILGGGSVAAGGLGMAGGMTVLVGGSGILGAIAGGAAGKLISQLPQEAIALNVVKVVNLINYLKSKENPDIENTQVILTEAKTIFLGFKQATEKEILLNGFKDKKDSIKLIDILNVGLKRII